MFNPCLIHVTECPYCPPGTNGLHSNIKSLDLSHNNISHVSGSFFRPAELSLTDLRLAHNRLRNATWDVFGSMPHLQWLDLADNVLRDIAWDAFRGTRRLQVLLLQGNRLRELHADTFRTLQQLRVVDLSRNELRQLPDGLFFGEGLERLVLSDNELARLPLAALSHGAAATLRDLDLAGNRIAHVPGGELFGRFAQLRTLDLTRNALAQLDSATFAPLVRLTSLDLSYNAELRPDAELRAFLGLDEQLTELRLDNTSLSGLRRVPLSNLRVLSLRGNALPTLPAELSVNMSRLLELDLSDNELTHVPALVARLPALRKLSLAGNALTQFGGNDSRLPARLAELDLRRLARLELVEEDALCEEERGELRVVRAGPWPHLVGLLHSCVALRELHIHSDEEDVNSALDGPLPPKLNRVTLSGAGIREVRDVALSGARAHSLELRLRDTSVHALSRDVFARLDARVSDVSIDVGEGNEELRELANPSTVGRPDATDGTWLRALRLGVGQPWSCDCELGWVETWLRKKRQYTCEEGDEDAQPDVDEDGKEVVFETMLPEEDACEPLGDDLRLAECRDRGNVSLLDTLKNELECGWSGATRVTRSMLLAAGAALVLILPVH